ncbi:hypothetical protein PhCBS80983_g05728 [Powellomyces hirtus]|uniref:DH domain-containing protein n=1 Tax=Powellomyces hirtus TaxID=109895 RepID=A0A507DSU5_9FUNG|nr:hypothetical protein PhCBS80983_g05728 [Powellomyces hirtus]
MDIDGALNIHTMFDVQNPPADNIGMSPKSAKLANSRWRPQSGHFSLKTGGARSFDNLASPTAPRELSAGSLRGLRRVQSVKDQMSIDPRAGSPPIVSPSPVDFPGLIAHGSSDLAASGGSLHAATSDGTAGSGGPQQQQSLQQHSQPAHAPVVRSRSSYSFQAMNSVLTVPNLMRNIRKQSLAPAAAVIPVAPSAPTTVSTSPDGKATETSPSAGVPSVISKNDRFLNDIGAQAFSGVWNHPITRCYFLMFLLWKEYENLFYFRLDSQQFRLDYPTLYSSARKSQAYRLYNTYLVKNSPMFILRRVPSTYQNVHLVIKTIKAHIDNHDATLFDDLSYMVLNWLVDIYNGSFESRLDGIIKGPDSPVEDTSGNSFIASAMHQAMRNDLRGTRHLTTVQYNRVAERITDMPPVVYDGNDVWDKLMSSLEQMGLNCESFRVKGVGAAVGRRPSQKQSEKESKATSRTRSFSNINDTRKSHSGSETPEESSTPALKEWRKTSNNQLNANAYSKNDLAHTFVQYTNGDQIFCEYCFRTLRNGNEGPINTYRCESCGYMCHKQCRKETRVSCTQASTTLEVEDQTEILSDKTQRITEKMQAIQREIDIEMKIRDGLNNLARAKSELNTKAKKAAPLEVDSQMERSGKKLEVLKHELQKCRLQLAALSAAAAAAATAALRSADCSPAKASASGGSGHQRMPSTASAILQDIDRDGDVVKIVTMDAAQKAESTKSFYVTSETLVKQLIIMALEKFMLPGNNEDYFLSYTSPEGEEVPLRHEDHPYRLGLDLINTPFRLKVNFDANALASPPLKTGASSGGFPAKLSKEEEVRHRKQREVLMEITDTEINYTEDLRNIVTLFYKPLTAAGALTAEHENSIFSNIKDILAIHSAISKVLVVEQPRIMETDVLADIIALFAKRVEALRAYETYCGNQHNARRTLERLRMDPGFAKILAQCEANPKLQKLNLPDLLVKPMHRVTRYPILFKRLLSYIPKGLPEHDVVNTLINNIEDKVADINESVRKHEAEYRIHVIDENLDFNGVTERFKIANGRRELISEKTFTYLKKNTNGTVEISVVFFTDLVLIIRPKKAGDSYILFKPPIPLEAAVFLDKPDSHGMKNMFLIIHLQQEIHSLQAISAYDKNNWLQESEAIRSQFCSLHFQYEHKILKDSVAKYQHADSGHLQPGAGQSFSEAPVTASSRSSSPSPRRRYTASPHSSLRHEKNIVNLEDGSDVNPMGEITTVPLSSSAGSNSNIKRTGSWAHLFKSNNVLGTKYDTLRKSTAFSVQTLPENQQIDQLPALPTRTMSDDVSAHLTGSSGSGKTGLDDEYLAVSSIKSLKTGGLTIRQGSSVSFHSNVINPTPSTHKSKTSLTSSKSSKGSKNSVRDDYTASKKEKKKARKQKQALASVVFEPAADHAEKVTKEPITPSPPLSSVLADVDAPDATKQPSVPASPLDISAMTPIPPSRAATVPEAAPQHKRDKRSSWTGSGKHWWTWSKSSKGGPPQASGSGGTRGQGLGPAPTETEHH